MTMSERRSHSTIEEGSSAKEMTKKIKNELTTQLTERSSSRIGVMWQKQFGLQLRTLDDALTNREKRKEDHELKENH